VIVASIDWVIVGGESKQDKDHTPRQFDQDWARQLLRQCRSTGAAFFMKQLGGLRHNTNPAPFDADLRVREWPQ
jgi:protein gp37